MIGLRNVFLAAALAMAILALGTVVRLLLRRAIPAATGPSLREK